MVSPFCHHVTRHRRGLAINSRRSNRSSNPIQNHRKKERLVTKSLSIEEDKRKAVTDLGADRAPTGVGWCGGPHQGERVIDVSQPVRRLGVA